MNATPGTFVTRVRGRLDEVRSEQAELVELEESWARGLAANLAELVFSVAEEERALLGFGYPVVAAESGCRWGEGRFAYASDGSLREGVQGGWVYERIALDERGGIRIVTCAPGRDDPRHWEGLRDWPASQDAFFPEEVFDCLRGIMSAIVNRMDELRREVEERRAGLDQLPGLVREFGAACGMDREGDRETSGARPP